MSQQNIRNDVIELTRTYIEKEMMTLDPDQSSELHRMYLAGVIETFYMLGKIHEEEREILYLEYCS